MTIRSVSDETNATSIKYGQLMIDVTNIVSGLLLIESIPGESFLFNSNSSLAVEITKISGVEFDFCAPDTIDLSKEFIDTKLTQETDYLDCTVMITSNNLYDATNTTFSNEYTFQSEFVWVDVGFVNTTQLTTVPLYESVPNANASIVNDHEWVDVCNPIHIKLNSRDPNSTYWFPLCLYYNETIQAFDNTGCYLLYYNNDYFECNCLHNTYFGVSWEEFVPEINYWGHNEWENVTWKTLGKYPLGWICVLVWLLFCGTIIIFFHFNKEKLWIDNKYCSCNTVVDKPLIALGDMSHLNKDKHQILQYKSIQEIRILHDDELKHRPVWIKWAHLYLIALKNDHVWIGLFLRHNGTSYTQTQRILILMVRLLTSMAIGALFYGRAKKTSIGDVSLS